MSPATALVLLGFGVGALVVAGRSKSQGTATTRACSEVLRARTIDAQRRSAVESRIARDLLEQWNATKLKEPS